MCIVIFIWNKWENISLNKIQIDVVILLNIDISNLLNNINFYNFTYQATVPFLECCVSGLAFPKIDIFIILIFVAQLLQGL